MSTATNQLLVPKKRDPVKGHGTQGRKFPLSANHYQLKCPTGGYFYHYDVDMAYSKEHKGKGDAKPSAPAARDRGRGESSSAAGPKLPKAVKKRAMDIFKNMPENKNFLNESTPAYDGEKSLYSTKEFKIQAVGSYSQIVTLPKDEEGGEKVVKVTIQPCQPLQIAWNQLDPATPGRSPTMHSVILQCINTVFREAALATATNIAIRRSYFTRDLRPIGKDRFGNDLAEMGQGREIWGGFYSSARLTEWKVTLNLDKTNTVFYKRARLLDFLTQVFRMRASPATLTVGQRKEFEKEVKTLKVETTHGPSGIRRVRVAGVTAEAADKLFFEMNGQKTSVKDYFKKTYPEIALKFPGLPCLKIGTKGNFMPIEVCTLLEQKCDRRMTPDQTAAMVKACTQPPDQRKSMVKGIRDNVVKYDTDATLKAFGISVDKEMVKVEGRHLDPPKMLAKDNKTIDPNNKDGTFNPGNVHFSEPATLKNWVCFVLYNAPQGLLEFFLDEFVKMGRQKGMAITPANQKLAARLDMRSPDFAKAFRETQNNFGAEKLDLIMVITDSREHYPEVKKAGDIAVGVVTQVVNAVVMKKNADNPRGPGQYIGNLLLKVNAKLGGQNIQVAGFGGKTTAALIAPEKAKLLLRFTELPTIVFGADVTHPSPGEANTTPSVAAVVASWNRYFTKYSARVRAQGHRAEMMADLGEMFCELMIEFRKRNNDTKPKRIIFYRDGVSEGQFDTVLALELDALQKACLRLEKDYKPQITYIIVGKRHHTRFFCQNSADQAKSGNVPAGTVVDRGIVHPTEMDYFLCSHGGIQGTSRPAHYNVLYDDADYTADEIETFSYYLTYCYARCSRSVSIPTPVYYAHLVAFRARHHLADADGSDTASSLSAAVGGGPSPRVAALNDKITLHPNIKDSRKDMYWM